MIEQSDVRLARIADSGQIATMSRDLIEYGLGWSWTETRVRGAMRKSECNVAVVKCDARVTGFGIMEYGWETAHLVLFAVRPEARRKQVGSRLLNWLEETAIVAGLQRIKLETRVNNDVGRSFYRARGYRAIGRVHGYYAGRESAIQMVRDLRPASR